MTLFSKLSDEWMDDPKFRAGYEELEGVYPVAIALSKARIKAGLTQAEVAKRMGTTQSAVARIENAVGLPTLKVVRAYARATGNTFELRIVPIKARRAAKSVNVANGTRAKPRAGQTKTVGRAAAE